MWGRGLFGHRGHPGIAIFFGIFPDIFSFGIFGFVRALQGEFQMGPPPLNIIPDWVVFNYNLSHSFVTALVVIGAVAIRKRNLAFTMLGWPLHILMDFPFHTRNYFPTHFLWPLTDFSIDGIPWSHPLVWFPNLAGIIFLYLYRFKQKRK